jgi:hypothetical protein
MALFSPSESPAIVVKEVDLTGGVPNVQSTTGAIVGNFLWGPVEERVLVANEAGLIEAFAAPNSVNTVDFHSASYFLRYSNALFVARVGDSAENAYVRGPSILDSAVLESNVIKNATTFEQVAASKDALGYTWIAKYPGALGNSLQVSYVTAIDSAGAFTAWPFATSFDGRPGTSTFATSQGATSANDEIHVAVIDQDGQFSGTRGTVLEIYPYMSLASNAKRTDGTSTYLKDVINTTSNYVYLAGFDTTFDSLAGSSLTSTTQFYKSGSHTFSFDSGRDLGRDASLSELLTGYDLFEDKDTVTLDFLIAAQRTNRTDATTLVNDLVSTAQSTRKDCIVVTSPARTDVVNSSTPVTSSVTTADTFTGSSYLVVDNNYLKVYDKFNDQYIYIPAASSTAGVMAASDLNTAPWFSPAGARRGQYLGITGLSYSPTKAERDTLYKAGINPIANIPGQGVLLFGDKTKLNRPSAFDRINVRRLFLILERAIAIAARNTLFEFNDEFTRAEFVNIVEPFLREVKGRRGITDFRVICDETNNTPEVIDRNEFIANIFIKPARSINYITLNFVAVRTGVDFEEVAGLAF